MANEFVIKNGYFSQGNSNVTGSLQVTGSVGVTGSVSITQDVTASKALFSSSNGDQLTVIGSGSTIAQVYGSQGNLLTVNDTFSGSIFTVTDISGYPILDVISDYYTSSINTVGFLNHTGSARVTGSLIVSGGFIVYDALTGFDNIDSNTHRLYDNGGNRSIDWQDRILKDATAANSIDWDQRRLLDSSITPSLLYSSRELYAADGATIQMDWSNVNYIKFPSINTSVPIVNVLGLDINGNLYATASTAFGGGSTFNSTSSFLGNGLSSSFNINHGFNTLNLHITVYSASGTYETVYPDIRRVNTNTASVVFANPPLTNEYIVYISQ
jgi:hypothetical protein